MTSNKIMKVKDYNDFVWYKSQCDCGSDDHIQNISLEYDKDINQIILTLDYQLSACDSINSRNFFGRLWWRFKTAIKTLFCGYIVVRGDFIFENEKHIKEYIDGLEEGIKTLKTKNKIKGVTNGKRSK